MIQFFSLNISVPSFPGNKEGLQEIHEAYQILLKIIMGAKNRFKKKSQELLIYTKYVLNFLLKATVQIIRLSKMMTPDSGKVSKKSEKKKSSKNKVLVKNYSTTL